VTPGPVAARRPGSPHRVMRAFVALTFLDYFGDMCITVTSVLLLRQRGFSSAGILWLVATVWLLEAVLEVPTGAFADAMGRRLSVVVSFTIRGVGYSLLFFSASKTIAVAGVLTASVGGPFASGALEAWAVDHLQMLSRAVNLDRVFTFGKVAESSGIVAGLLTGAGLGQMLGLAVPQLAAGAVCMITAAVCTIVLGRAQRESRAAQAAPDGALIGPMRNSARDVVRGVRLALRSDRVLTALLVVSAGMWLIRGIPGVQWTVHFDVITGGTLIALGIARALGDLLQIPLLTVVARVTASPGKRRETIALAAACAAVCLVCAALLPGAYLGIALYVLFTVCWGLCMPGIKAAINERAASSTRATLLSVGGMLNAVATGAGLYTLGIIGLPLSAVSVTWPLAGVAVLVAGLAGARLCRPGPAVKPARQLLDAQSSSVR